VLPPSILRTSRLVIYHDGSSVPEVASPDIFLTVPASAALQFRCMTRFSDRPDMVTGPYYGAARFAWFCGYLVVVAEVE